jgi:hypothetical protein
MKRPVQTESIHDPDNEALPGAYPHILSIGSCWEITTSVALSPLFVAEFVPYHDIAT